MIMIMIMIMIIMIIINAGGAGARCGGVEGGERGAQSAGRRRGGNIACV
jgi:hypothetical protein